VSFARSSIETTLVRGILFVAGLGTGVINARWLGPEGVGIVALAILLRLFAFRIGNLGFGSAFAYFVARRETTGRAIVMLAIWTSLATSLLACAVVALTWKLPRSPWQDIDPTLIHISMATIPIYFVRTQLQRVLSGELRIREMNFTELVTNIGYLAFVVVALVILDMGLVGSIAALLAAECLSLTYVLWRSSRQPPEADDTPADGVGERITEGRPSIAALWRYGRWNYVLMLSNFVVEELPLLLLKSLSGNAASVGLMSRAQGLARQPRVIALPIGQVLFPFTAASDDDAATQRTNVLCRNSLLVVSLFVAALTLFIRPLLQLLYGEEFLPATEIFYALALGAAVWPTSHFLAIHIAASGAPKHAFVASSIASVAAIALCATLIPAYGAIGAGISATAIYVIRVAVLLVIYHRLTAASPFEVLLPQRSDLIYYRRILEALPLDRLRRA
jgi:O-antigen/teichoic acid export membrane protein